MSRAIPRRLARAAILAALEAAGAPQTPTELTMRPGFPFVDAARVRRELAQLAEEGVVTCASIERIHVIHGGRTLAKRAIVYSYPRRRR